MGAAWQADAGRARFARIAFLKSAKPEYPSKSATRATVATPTPHAREIEAIVPKAAS